jgi:hypothetical protein
VLACVLGWQDKEVQTGVQRRVGDKTGGQQTGARGPDRVRSECVCDNCVTKQTSNMKEMRKNV